MSTWQPADEIVAHLHRTVVESGADAASLTFGRTTLHVTPTRARVVVFGEQPRPVPLPSDQTNHVNAARPHKEGT